MFIEQYVGPISFEYNNKQQFRNSGEDPNYHRKRGFKDENDTIDLTISLKRCLVTQLLLDQCKEMLYQTLQVSVLFCILQP